MSDNDRPASLITSFESTRPSTVTECVEAHAKFVRILGRLPVSQLGQFKSMVERDLGHRVFTKQ